MDIDSIKNHTNRLINRHANLESELAQRMNGASWDEIEVENLKKQKLKIKDEIVQMHYKQLELELDGR